LPLAMILGSDRDPLVCAQTSVLIFVWPGSAAQIGAGFLITLGSLLMAMAVRPFEDKELGFMHCFSLVVQAITLYSGIMLLTQRLVLLCPKKS
jgi:hypothetical protein